VKKQTQITQVKKGLWSNKTNLTNLGA